MYTNLIVLLSVIVFPQVLLAWSSLNLQGVSRYNETSTQLSYANPEAPQGGALRMGLQGSFDTLNPYSIKGHSPLFMDLVFQTLGQRTLDDAHSGYPQVAEDFILASDHKSMRVKLFKSAKFSDGHPLTSEDVAFSFAILQTAEANPFYKSYWSEFASCKVLGPHEVEFRFKRYYKELPALIIDLPILAKHFYGRGSFSKDFATRALGSGPYSVDVFKFGSMLRLKRNPNFWAREYKLNRGRFNFDSIGVEYFHEMLPLIESLKNGQIDFLPSYNLKSWFTNLVGPKFDRHWIVKEEWKQEMNQGASAYFFNLRKPLLQDIRVRKALLLALDFAWANRVLFHGKYLESNSLYENSPFKASGLPSQKEKKTLSVLKKRFPEEIPDEVLKEPFASLGKGLTLEQRLSQARTLLKEAGYIFDKGVLKGPQGPLSLHILLRTHSDLRVVEPYKNNLARLGIKLQIDLKDKSTFMHKLLSRDFDMFEFVFPASMTPGYEQVALWHSRFAKSVGTQNHLGVSNKAVDALLDRIVSSETQDDIMLAFRCLDRLMHHLYVGVPKWYTDTYRVAFWNKFAHPSLLPLYYFEHHIIDLMWVDPSQEQRLRQAMGKGASL
jgi:microcin C transport system substrate-binding protein